MSQPPYTKARLDAARSQNRQALEKSQQSLELQVKEILNKTFGVSPPGRSKPLAKSTNCFVERLSA